MASFPKPIPAFNPGTDPDNGVITVQDGHDPTNASRNVRGLGEQRAAALGNVEVEGGE